MSDQEIIDGAIADHLNGDVISDLQARVLANSWHGGQVSSLYSLASCGATVKDPRLEFKVGCHYSLMDQDGGLLMASNEHWLVARAEREFDADHEDDVDVWVEIVEPLSELVAEIEAIADAEQAAPLLAYVESVGPRGRVEGWSNLNW